jgi:hypothetical protein
VVKQERGAIMSDDVDFPFQNDDYDGVDYLHPNGKPPEYPTIVPTSEYRPDWKGYMSYNKALEEADGHSICKYDPFLHGDSQMQLTGKKVKFVPLFSGRVNRWIIDAMLTS